MKKRFLAILLILNVLSLLLFENSFLSPVPAKAISNTISSAYTLESRRQWRLGDHSGKAYFKFVPDTSREYVIYSVGDEDTYVELLDSNGYRVSSNDDGGQGFNFRLSAYLNAGQSYYFLVYFLSSSTIADLTFFFGETYTIQYDANGGVGAPSMQYVDYGQDFIVSKDVPTRVGYKFVGWSTSSYDSTVEYYPDASETYYLVNNRTLYAVWESDSEVLLVNSANTAYIEEYEQWASYSFTPTTSGEYIIYSKGGTEPTGVVLYDSERQKIASDNIYQLHQNFKLSYYLEAGKTYYYSLGYCSLYELGSISFNFGRVSSVNYDANGGVSAPESIKKNFGEIVLISSGIPSREGYTFLGWSTSKNSTSVDYQAGSAYDSESDITLYAVWQSVAPTNVITNEYSCEIKEDGTLEIIKYSGDSSIVSIPSKIENYTVSSIGDSAFRGNKNIQNIILTDSSITKIGAHAFDSCELLFNVGLPATIKEIGSYAFYNCPALSLVAIPEGVKNIGEYSFGYDSSSNLVFGFSIIGYGGTAAEKYASKNGITFNNLGGSGSASTKKVTIKFIKKSVKIKRGKKVTLKVKITGAKKATFSVNKKGKKVVKLSKKKAKSVVVKGKKKGKAVITAKAAGKKTACKVTVK